MLLPGVVRANSIPRWAGGWRRPMRFFAVIKNGWHRYSICRLLPWRPRAAQIAILAAQSCRKQ